MLSAPIQEKEYKIGRNIGRNIGKTEPNQSISPVLKHEAPYILRREESLKRGSLPHNVLTDVTIEENSSVKQITKKITFNDMDDIQSYQ